MFGTFDKRLLLIIDLFVCLFHLILYVPVNNFSVISVCDFRSWTSNKHRIKH